MGFMLRATSLSLLAWTSLMSESLAQPAPEDFIIAKQGALPIVISAPHGGATQMPGVPERQNRGANQFVTTRDLRTLELAAKISSALERQLGHAPFVMIAKFDRKQIDANRPAADGYDPPGSGGPKLVYDAYHRALANARTQVEQIFRRGILLDIHGQGRENDAIFRGTNNGQAVAHLVRRSGEAAVRGPKSIFGLLAAQGYRVIPPLVAGAREDQLDGGHIVQTYGSGRGGSVDAMQLEFGAKLRAPENLDKTASDVAEAVAVFAKEYLPAAK